MREAGPIAEMISRSQALFLKGQLDEADSACRGILAAEPSHSEAIHLLGVIAHEKGDYPRAVGLISQALSARPDNPKYLGNLGLSLSAAGQPEQAVAVLRRAAELAPGNPDFHNNLGLVLQRCGGLEAARQSYRKALELNPRFPEAEFNLGTLLESMGRRDEALDHYRRAIGFKPDYGRAHHQLGNALRSLGRIDEAIAALHEALRCKPDSIGTLNDLGNALKAAGRHPEAVKWFNKALALAPDSADTWCNLGNVLSDRRAFREALECYNRAIALQPGYAEVYFNRACLRLQRGEFVLGWEDYEWRLQRPVWKNACAGRLALPRWQGDPFPGRKVLVYDEQGLGDTIQFARFLPMVKARGGEVIFETRANLMPLFRDFNGIDRLLERQTPERPSAEADFYLPLLSLPHVLHTRLETILWPGPYIRSSPEKRRQWAHRLARPGFRIGIVWTSRNVGVSDRARECPLYHFTAITRIPHVVLYGLQKEIERPQRSAKADEVLSAVSQLGCDLHDFGDTAAVIDHLDLVISVDTSVAHLAGAMGKPVWVLLPRSAEWRWLLDRGDSPWYPTMRLFRQKSWGGWADVMDRIAAEIRKQPRVSPIG